MIPEEFTEVVGSEVLSEEFKNNMSHNLKMFTGLTITFLVGAFSAYQNGFNVANVIVMVIAGLTSVEHQMNGNS